jgi:acyl-CoA thioester hydrolase
MDEARDRWVWPVRVYYEDTDAGGVVYYANYLKFAERARTELLRDSGLDHTKLAQEHGVQIVVRNCAIEYMAPARLDDLLEVRSRIATIGGASFTIRQEIFRMETSTMMEALLVTAEVRLACIDAAFHPARLPKTLQQLLGHTKAI